jgi:hypothetical protein
MKGRPKSQDQLLSEFAQSELLEPFLERPDFLVKKMFGGLCVYLNGRMSLVLMEGALNDTVWKSVDYGSPIWRGLMVPTEYDHQPSLIKDIPALRQHPVLKKWLWIPLDHESYDEASVEVIRRLRREDPRLGILPKARGQRRSSKKKSTLKTSIRLGVKKAKKRIS